jgi:putative SOS response-associated peptidase YedK
MCGRYVVASSPSLLAERLGVDDMQIDDAEPDYNVAPRAQIMVVRQREDTRILSRVRWGLVPSWAKDPSIGDRMINARAEQVADKPAFRRAFEKRRCLVPADGFYEWEVVAPPSTPKGRPKKQPVFIQRRDGEPMAFAGLVEVWKVPDGFEPMPEGVDDGWLISCAIVTTEPNALLAPIHDRMPVVLPEDAWERWLDPEARDPDALLSVLRPAPDDMLELWPVSTEVNSADNNRPELVKPIGPTATHG